MNQTLPTNPSSEPFKPGDVLGNWELAEVIGYGGMGAVWRAHRVDLELSMQAAVKVLKEQLVDVVSQTRFRRERQILADLKHPYVATLIDAGTTDAGFPYFVMEYIEGETLDHWLVDAKPGPRESLLLLRKICLAVRFAHDKGVIHRDIKPGNIMVTSDQVPKLLDFGIAMQVTDVEQTALTGLHQNLMTPEYAAPEQLHGQSATDKSDIYSLGLLALFLFTGKKPRSFGGDPEEAVRRYLEDTGEITPEIAGFILSCLKKSPLERFNSLNAMIESIDGMLLKDPDLSGFGSKFDILIWAHPSDRSQALDLKTFLETHSQLRIWLAPWEDLPNEAQVSQFGTVLGESKCCFVLYGGAERAPWEDRASRKMVSAASSSIQVVPVLLEGSKRPSRESDLPRFLRQKSWLSLSGTESSHDLEALVQAARGVVRFDEAPFDIDTCPFRGLQVFREEDEAFFFGREGLVQRLSHQIQEHRMLGLLGPSGSGKSSVLQAGVIPTRRRAGDLIVLMTPGTHPLEECALALSDLYRQQGEIQKLEDLISLLENRERGLHLLGRELAELSKSSRLLLVIDQFEEMITLADPGQATQMMRLLVHALEQEDGPFSLALSLRSDFLGNCVVWSEFNQFLVDNMVQVGPMNQAQIHEAIVRPVLLVGGQLDPGLAEALIADIGQQTGALPLLQYALSLLWERAENGRLSLADYHEMGRLFGALELRAEDIYSALDTAEQEACRRILLRLVQQATAATYTRRRARYEELIPDQERVVYVRALKALIGSHLITIEGEDSEARVEVAHEALIVHWSRMKRWLDASCEQLKRHEELAEAAHAWRASEHDAAYLLRGVRLAVYDHWVDADLPLNALEAEFLNASQLQQIAEAEAEVENRRVLKRRALIAMAAGAVSAVLAVLAIIAFTRAEAHAERAQENSEKAQENAEQAQINRKQALDLVVFMAEDLAEKLDDEGQLGLMGDVVVELRGYLEKMPNDPVPVDDMPVRAKILKNIGRYHSALKEYKVALENHTQAARFLELYLVVYPSNSEIAKNLADEYFYVGAAHRRFRVFDLSEQFFLKNLKLLEAWEKRSDDLTWKVEQAYTRTSLLKLYRKWGKKSEIEDLIKKQDKAFGGLANDLENNDVRVAFYQFLEFKVEWSRLQGNVRDALAFQKRAYELARIGIESDPDNLRLKGYVAQIQARLGEIALLSGDLSKAEQSIREVLETRRYLLSKEPTNTKWRDKAAFGELQLVNVFLEKRDFRAAERELRKLKDSLPELLKEKTYISKRWAYHMAWACLYRERAQVKEMASSLEAAFDIVNKKNEANDYRARALMWKALYIESSVMSKRKAWHSRALNLYSGKKLTWYTKTLFKARSDLFEGSFEAAREKLKTMREAGYNNQDLRDLERRLAQK